MKETKNKQRETTACLFFLLLFSCRSLSFLFLFPLLEEAFPSSEAIVQEVPPLSAVLVCWCEKQAAELKRTTTQYGTGASPLLYITRGKLILWLLPKGKRFVLHHYSLLSGSFQSNSNSPSPWLDSTRRAGSERNGFHSPFAHALEEQEGRRRS